MSQNYEKGARLMVELCSGDIFEGIFCYGDNMKLSLTKLTAYPDKVEFPGLYHFYNMEILSVTVMDEKDKNDDQKNVELQINPTEYDILKELAHKYTYLAMFDSKAHSAIEFIKTCTEISVIGFGSLFGRNNKISLLGIGTKSEIFLFDIKISGQRSFDLGLRSILEADDITKIVHNSKILADCLYHCYKVSLKNVFDTQVADYMITQKNEGRFPEKMKIFADCVNIHLKIPANIIKKNEVSQKQINERPLTDELKINSSLQLAYLFVLKTHLNKRMLLGFNLTTECFLNCMKYEDPAKSLSLHKNDVPKVVKELGLTL